MFVFDSLTCYRLVAIFALSSLAKRYEFTVQVSRHDYCVELLSRAIFNNELALDFGTM